MQASRNRQGAPYKLHQRLHFDALSYHDIPNATKGVTKTFDRGGHLGGSALSFLEVSLNHVLQWVVIYMTLENLICGLKHVFASVGF